jgi:protocatechuate 3,4-dioxygenase beta subunit
MLSDPALKRANCRADVSERIGDSRERQYSRGSRTAIRESEAPADSPQPLPYAIHVKWPGNIGDADIDVCDRIVEVSMTLLIASLTLVSTLVASQTLQGVAQMGRVSGQVIEEGTNTPVADAQVFVLLDGEFSAPAGPPKDTVADRDGRYHFDALPAGRYRIAAHKVGFAPSMDPTTMQLFEVAGSQALDGVIVSLRRGGVITGRVLDPQGQPLPEAGVTALLKRLDSSQRPSGPVSSGMPLLMPFGQGQTNDLGEFRIFGLPPGEYVIAANVQSRFGDAATAYSAPTTMTSTFFPDTADVNSALPVTVRSGETASDLTIRLITVPAFQVSGVVVDESGAPVANAMVMLMDGSRGNDSFLSLTMGPQGMSQSDASGRFTFGNVPAGSYTVRADGGLGGIGSFGLDTFIIDSGGTPRADPSAPRRAREPGTIEVAVENANVSDLKIVVPRSR